MLDELRNLNLDRIDLDDAVALFTFGKELEKSYEVFLMEVPDWVKTNLESLNKEIKSRRRDNLEKELKKAKLNLEALKTADERRNDLRAKIERLQSALS